MKLMTRDTDYAVRALMYITKSKEKIVAVSEIQKSLGLPKPFLRKILQILQKESILRSVKGNKGGFILDVNPKTIFLVDLIGIFQGGVSLTECFLKKEVCPDIKVCPVRKKLKSIETSLIKELNKISIASLLDCS
ncbi:MAG: Rrf2 family transcriptional regulator [Candidatus Zapsychrus exili]|nr:Rrf2 family transcriptional regulator [Candidatus Zapsychrus exili]